MITIVKMHGGISIHLGLVVALVKVSFFYSRVEVTQMTMSLMGLGLSFTNCL
jgi:hypothetical protein